MNKWISALAITLALTMTNAVADDDSPYPVHEAVNINTANLEELDKLLYGIGVEKAQAIIDYREENGPFLSADDLAKIKGIGQSTVAKNRERIILE